MAFPATSTALDIIKAALRDRGVIGIGQTPNAEDTNDAFSRLNQMIAQWRKKRWLVYHLIDQSKLSNGSQFYTIGPGGDIDVGARPDKIESAFFRQLIQSQPNQIDYPLEILTAREDYNAISIKRLQSFPMYLFYDSDWPLGKLYPWPVMQPDIYELHVSLKFDLPYFATVTAQYLFPDEYFAGMEYNLAIRLGPNYTAPPNAELIGLAKDSLNVIRGAYTQIGRLFMPTDLTRPGIYNPYSDQIR
jgi:hypothetical protein